MPDPNNVALRDCGIVFMLLPKVANTSIKLALLKAQGRPLDKIHAQGVFECVDTAEARTFPLRIAVVRDPLDRLASCWRDKIIERTDGRFLPGLAKMGLRPGMEFAEFVEFVADTPDHKCGGVAQHFRSQAWSLADEAGVVPNLLIRFEALDQRWPEVQAAVRGAGGPALPVLTQERRTEPTRGSYTPRARALALQRYRDDVRLFGYRPPLKYEIDPDRKTRGRSICNVHREAYRVARDEVDDPAVSQRLTALMAEAFDMGKRMNARLPGGQYEE